MTIDVIIITRTNEETRRLSCFEVKLWLSVFRNSNINTHSRPLLFSRDWISCFSNQQPATGQCSHHHITSCLLAKAHAPQFHLSILPSCLLSLVSRRLRLVRVEFQPAETYWVLVCLTSLELKLTLILTFAAQKSMLFDSRYLSIACLA
jgi:hypothetical protein